jgi:glycerate 2-kinase
MTDPMTVRGIPSAVLVAPDSFKGTFSAPEVAAAIAAGLRSAGREAWELPVADGGEGTLAVLAGPLGLELIEAPASDPLGRPLTGQFGIVQRSRLGPLAVVETATASGLDRVPEAVRDAVAASTFGTGELIAAALAAGATEIHLAVGGSATTDGGFGAIEAIEQAGGFGRAKLTILCDVRTPFEDAGRVFGPQKGADPATVRRLSARLARQAQTLADRYDRDPRGVPMTGGAGGLSGGLWAAYGAQLVAGAPFVLDALGFDAKLRAARAVVTGEGRIDRQSLAGKLAAEVATRARQVGVPSYAVVGRNELDRFDTRILDLQLVIEAGTVAQFEAAGAQLAEQI